MDAMVEVKARAGDLRLLIPADTEHLRAARLVAADAGRRAGFDCEDIDDLRIAVDELCHCLMHVSAGPISLTFGVTEHGVTVEGKAVAGSPVAAPVLDPFSEAIVHSATDHFELETDAPHVRFAFDKVGAHSWV